MCERRAAGTDPVAVLRTGTLLAVCFCLAAPLPRAAAAQSAGSIVGRVVTSPERTPVAGARVFVQGSADTAVTAGDGLFRLESLPVGRHVLRLDYLGMRSRDVPVELDSRHPVSLDIALSMSVIPVAELVVTVDRRLPVNKLFDFYRRMAHGQGVFFTRADVRARHPARITDLLRDVPGIQVGPPRPGRVYVTMGRRPGCIPEYYVDGARAPGFDLDDLQPSDLAGLEVYRGNSEVPMEFKAFERCGAIVVWTREPGARQ